MTANKLRPHGTGQCAVDAHGSNPPQANRRNIVTPNRPEIPVPLSRRAFLALGAGTATAAVVAACSTSTSAGRGVAVAPNSDAVRIAEEARRAGTARRVSTALRAAPATIDLGGVEVQTWAFDGRIPGPEIRLRRGDVLRADLTNGLPADSTIHWHGIALRNDMDGVPGLTQTAIAPGGAFSYEFAAPDAGTHWFHPHVGLQFDRGLYAPLIVEDPDDGRDYDLEAVIVLDDWLDGVTGDPDQQLAKLRKEGMPMRGMSGGGSMEGMAMPVDPHAPLGTDAGDIDYPYYLINGKIGTDPVTVAGRPGQRLRLRIINAGADTAFRVVVGGHLLTVTHCDGYPVQPKTGNSLLIGMGERYDVVLTLGDGVFPLVAAAEGKKGQGFALIRTASGDAPAADVRPTELGGTPITSQQLSAAEAVRLSPRTPDRVHDLVLETATTGYTWTINGKIYGEHIPLEVTQGERVRLRFVNKTMMFHPMHLHGHTFEVVKATEPGPRKDTALVLANQTVEVDLDATNPGQWAVHCHNLYHGEAGMMSVLSYVT